MNTLTEKQNKMSTVEIGVIVLLALYYLLPSVSLRFNFMLPVIIGVGYAACTYFNRPIAKETVKYLVLMAFVALLYAILTDAASVSHDAYYEVKRFASKFYQMFMMFFPLFILGRVQECATVKQKRFLLAVMYALVAYILVTTTVELINNPDATRAWEGFDETAQENVGNYYFVYAIPLIMTVCTTLLYRYKQWSLRLLLIALLIGQLFFLLYAQYTLSVIAAIIGVFTAMFANIRHTYSKAIVVVAGIFSVALLPSILQFAMEHVPSEQMATRLEELYAFFSSGDSSGYNLNGRLSLYGKTLEAFLNSPIWGNRYLPFDGHGTFLTVLGDLGLLGAVPLYYMYFRARTRVSFWIGEGGKQFWPVFLVLFLTGLFNPIHAALPIMLTAWFIVPLTLSLTSSDKGGEENA